MNLTLRNIPQKIKRQVRQKCYFGCVICGSPVFTYDHFDEFSIVDTHTVDNINLLCPNHHFDKTTGKLSKQRLKEAALNPFNKSRALTSPFRFEGSNEMQVLVGSNKVENFVFNFGFSSILQVQDTMFFGLELTDGWISITFFMTDKNGQPVLVCNRGELQVFTSVYDFSYEGTTCTIREKKGIILLKISLSNSHIHIEKGNFLTRSKVGYIIPDNGAVRMVNGNPDPNHYMTSVSDSTFGYIGGSVFYIGNR